MYTLDASIFVRDLNPREPDHALCRDLLEHLSTLGTPIIVPLLLLIEVSGTLSRELRDPMRGRMAVTVLQAMPNLKLVALDESLAHAAAEIAADRALRGADSLYVAVARQHNCILVSLDREQRERGAAVVTTQTPAEALANLERGLS
ncbi:MAG: PIN domain-containing protein [Chloroflexales bacterium]|jgi:predicted nucleic acid-binding protein